MTELERRLADALRALSEQYEREQQRAAGQIAGFSEQVATLREQVEQLQGHVSDLAADYRRIAALLRRR